MSADRIVRAPEKEWITNVKRVVGKKLWTELPFCMRITEEQAEYVSAGDGIYLDFGAGIKKTENLTVDRILKSGTDGRMYEVHVTVPLCDLKIGETGSGVIEKETESYGTVVPLKALLMETTGRTSFCSGRRRRYLGRRRSRSGWM